jgi:signal transduction histidine kinase
LHYSIYLRLIVLTAGTLLAFFWIVVILGHRRQRNFERIFFFLCLALVFFFGGSLLALNAQLYYAAIPPTLGIFCWAVVCSGLWFLPSLLLHLQIEYAQVRELLVSKWRKRLWLGSAYLPALVLLPKLLTALRLRTGFDFVTPSSLMGGAFQIWLFAALAACSLWQWWFAKKAPDDRQRVFHRSVQASLAVIALAIFTVHLLIERLAGAPSGDPRLTYYVSGAALLALLPLVSLIRSVEEFNFLQIGRQRNLLYAVFGVFVALLYLSLIRRASQWLEPYLPPEASAALLLFLPVVFFEPLQRLVGRILRRTAQQEMDEAQRMMGPIVEVARLGSLSKLREFVEKWVSERMQLEKVELVFDGETTAFALEGQDIFPVWSAGRRAGVLKVKPYGAMLSGETEAALEFLCEQLLGALDLCRLIEEKLQLERELAERERLAVLGQMAASISHNLKNPLGSIKTILQVQMESPELPESIRGETKMVLEEIGRLSSKLNQLLQFSRPAVRVSGAALSCDARAVLEEVTGVLRHEAERRGVLLETKLADGNMLVAAGAEALSDIVSNLLVNALEASSRNGHVVVCAAASDGVGVLVVEDDGPGISASAREKILQPFFTTKAQGTGLGLAIVARRVSEFGGELAWESPVRDGRGTRFTVTLATSSDGVS